VLNPGQELRELEALRFRHGEGLAGRKLALVRSLGRRRLAGAKSIERWHEVLCFLRAFPDDAALLRAVERELGRFARRADLARHKEALADSGIAGTPIRFAFFAPTASWLARRHGELLTVDWDAFED